jgi:phage tail sheath protein FI
VEVADPLTKSSRLIPPSGHVAGLWARTDSQRGVHKAPANEQLMNVINVERQLTQVEAGSLNTLSVNCIRATSTTGIRVMGGRTLAEESSEWRYINVRRLVNYIAESIEQGTQWVVFEPNDDALWARVTRNVTAFLMTVWGRGALFGLTPEEAFFVKCDRETNPQRNIDMGVLTCQIGIAPVKPAEFVVFDIRQMTRE